MMKSKSLLALMLASAAFAATARADDGPVTPAEYEAAFDAALEEVTARDAPVTSMRRAPCPYRLRAPRRAHRKRWGFGISPYGFLADVSGEAWADGEKTSFDIPFEDLLENTNGGFMLYLEARYGRWFFAFDGTIAQLAIEQQGTLAGFDVTIDQLIADFRVGYRIQRWVVSRQPGKMGGKPCRTVDAYLFAGARYYQTELALTLTVLGRSLPKVTTTQDDLDPLLGLRVTADLSRRWSLDLRGEAAALGTSGTDRYSWETAAYLGYHVSQVFGVFIGWRAQGQVDVQGSGASRNGTDVTTHGPVIGAGFSF